MSQWVTQTSDALELQLTFVIRLCCFLTGNEIVVFLWQQTFDRQWDRFLWQQTFDRQWDRFFYGSRLLTGNEIVFYGSRLFTGNEIVFYGSRLFTGNEIVFYGSRLNSLWPNDVIQSLQYNGTWSTLVQVIACCLNDTKPEMPTFNFENAWWFWDSVRKMLNIWWNGKESSNFFA